MAGSGAGNTAVVFLESGLRTKTKRKTASVFTGNKWMVSGGKCLSVLVRVSGPQIYTFFQFPALTGGSANSLFRGRLMQTSGGGT